MASLWRAQPPTFVYISEVALDALLEAASSFRRCWHCSSSAALVMCSLMDSKCSCTRGGWA